MTRDEALDVLAFHCIGRGDDDVSRAIGFAIDAIERLEAIRAAHRQRAVTTDGGRVIYPSIHGHQLHALLHGTVERSERGAA